MTKTHHEPVISVVQNSFKAILDEQPGPGKQHKFFASVEIEVEIDWKVQLVATVPQGFNQFDKLLRFQVVEPKGTHSNAIVKRTVRYDEAPAEADYTNATLRNGPHSTTVEVEIVV